MTWRQSGNTDIPPLSLNLELSVKRHAPTALLQGKTPASTESEVGEGPAASMDVWGEKISLDRESNSGPFMSQPPHDTDINAVDISKYMYARQSLFNYY